MSRAINKPWLCRSQGHRHGITWISSSLSLCPFTIFCLAINLSSPWKHLQEIYMLSLSVTCHSLFFVNNPTIHWWRMDCRWLVFTRHIWVKIMNIWIHKIPHLFCRPTSESIHSVSLDQVNGSIRWMLSRSWRLSRNALDYRWDPKRSVILYEKNCISLINIFLNDFLCNSVCGYRRIIQCLRTVFDDSRVATPPYHLTPESIQCIMKMIAITSASVRKFSNVSWQTFNISFYAFHGRL